MRAVLSILVLAGVALGGEGGSAPKPSTVSKAWEVEYAFHDPQRISLLLPGDDRETTFWYVLYTVTNNAGREVPFYPTFDIVTDSLTVIEGGDSISPTVYDSIKARHSKAYPFFAYPSEMFGPLLQGEDNARTSAIAFVPPDPEVNRFTVYTGGLSGEIVKVRNLGFDKKRPESAGNPRFYTLRKTLAVSYDIPGDVRTRRQADPVRGKREWVMR